MKDFELPKLASGKIVPGDLSYQKYKEAKALEEQKRVFKHDWKIQIFSVLGGAVSGFITSFIFWLITNK